MPKLTRAGLVAPLLMNIATLAHAQAMGETIVLRPVRSPSPALVAAIATGAEPTILSLAAYPDAGDIPPARIIKALCGDVGDGYLDALEQINHDLLQETFGASKLPLDKALGSITYKVKWPACLRVDAQPKPIKIGPGDGPEKIYKRLTGDQGSRKALEAFFGETYSDLQAKKLGDVVQPGLVTRPQVITVAAAPLSDVIASIDDKAERASDPRIRRVQAPPPTKRSEPTLLIGAGAVSDIDRPAECGPVIPGVEPNPADTKRAVRIAKAFEHTRALLKAKAGRGLNAVEIMVVDNGFLGATKTANGVEIRPGFNSDLISIAYSGNVGPALAIGPTGLTAPTSPLLDPPVPWSDVAGHGTHVASLAMGGRDLTDRLGTILTPPGLVSFVTVAMVNIGNGKRQLLPGSAEAVRQLNELTNFRVVNFSLEYLDTSDEAIRASFDRVFEVDENRNKLFVAAAGNSGLDVTGHYPAAFGGSQKPNVITVAATLPSGSLAAFSNWSETMVDIAAPGCDVAGKIDQNADMRGMTGTSQAAPQVSYAAALVRTLGGLPARKIKTRLIISGSLLKPAPPLAKPNRQQPFMVSSRSQLDLERALYAFEDYVELDDGREYIGEVGTLLGVECSREPGSSLERDALDIYAFKKGHGQGWVITGRNGRKAADRPCAWTQATGQLYFVPTYRLTDDGPKALGPEDPAMVDGTAVIDEPLARVRRLIFGSDLAELIN